MVSEPREIKMEPHWKAALADQFTAPYMVQLRAFLAAEYAQGKVIYPQGKEYFHAFDATPLPAVKVVILGQDPYHGPGQAHGLCFSVRPGVPPPPSLVNIYKELRSDLGIEPPRPLHGCLEAWAQRGVLLLNSVLTVEQGRAGSHAGKGWEVFTDRVISILNSQCDGIAFVLWGSYAQKKGAMISRDKHFVLSTAHPSPLSAHRGFLGSRPFSQLNTYLVSRGKDPIDWKLPEISSLAARSMAAPRINPGRSIQNINAVP